MSSIVKVTWDPAWLSNGEAGALHWLLLLELANDTLPKAVAEALSVAYNQTVSKDAVVVHGEAFSSIGFNLPQVWIDIQGSEMGATPAERSRFRALIAELVQWRVSAFYRKFHQFVQPPMYDIEFRAIASSGRTVDESGMVTMTWG